MPVALLGMAFVLVAAAAVTCGMAFLAEGLIAGLVGIVALVPWGLRGLRALGVGPSLIVAGMVLCGIGHAHGGVLLIAGGVLWLGARRGGAEPIVRWLDETAVPTTAATLRTAADRVGSLLEGNGRPGPRDELLYPSEAKAYAALLDEVGKPAELAWSSRLGRLLPRQRRDAIELEELLQRRGEIELPKGGQK